MFLTHHFHRNLAGFVLNLILLTSVILNLNLNLCHPPPPPHPHIKHTQIYAYNNNKQYKNGLLMGPLFHMSPEHLQTHDDLLILLRTNTCTHICTCTHTHKHTHAHTQTHTRTHTHTHACMHTRMHARMHTHTHTRTHARTHARMHARTHAHTHTRTHTHTHINTHTHTHNTHTCKRKIKKLIESTHWLPYLVKVAIDVFTLKSHLTEHMLAAGHVYLLHPIPLGGKHFGQSLGTTQPKKKLTQSLPILYSQHMFGSKKAQKL